MSDGLIFCIDDSICRYAILICFYFAESMYLSGCSEINMLPAKEKLKICLKYNLIVAK